MPKRNLNLARQKALAKIHIAKKDMRLDEETYRSIILRVTNDRINSAGSLTALEMNALLAEFKRLGWKPALPKQSGKKAANGDWRSKRIWLINKLWGELGEAGVLTDPSTEALHTFCKNRMKAETLEWSSSAELNTIVDALKAWQRREAA